MNAYNKYRFLTVLVTAFVIIIGSQIVEAAGIAAIKEQTFHSDESAKLVVYSELKGEGTPSIKIVTGSKVFSINAIKLAAKVEVLSSLPINILSNDQLQTVRASLVEIQSFTKRFPKSATLLENQTKALSDCIKKYDEGKVRFRGHWIDKNEMLAIEKSEKERMEQEQLATAERRKRREAFELEQRAKGLVEYYGEWLSPEEAQRREAQDQAVIAKAKFQKDVKEASIRLQGNVIRSFDSGILVESHYGSPPWNFKIYDEGRPNFIQRGEYFLIGHPQQNSIVDDDWFDVDAVFVGIAEFETIFGGTKRYRKYQVVKSYY